MDITTAGVKTFGALPRGGQACIQLSGNPGGDVGIGFVLDPQAPPELPDTTFYPYRLLDGTAVVLKTGGMVVVQIPAFAQIALNFPVAPSTTPPTRAYVWQASTPTDT